MKLNYLIALTVLAGSALAAPQPFNFKDPKGVNNVTFKLDAPLESTSGSASGISGTVTFDPADPGATRGKVVAASASLIVPNPLMKEHLHSDKWLNVAKYPEITFEVKELRNARTSGDTTTADVTGVFTLKGKAKELTVPVKLTYLKDKLGARTNGQVQGDLLVIRANFSINRSEFGIMPGQYEDKVSETIDLTLSIAGAAPR